MLTVVSSWCRTSALPRFATKALYTGHIITDSRDVKPETVFVTDNEKKKVIKNAGRSTHVMCKSAIGVFELSKRNAESVLDAIGARYRLPRRKETKVGSNRRINSVKVTYSWAVGGKMPLLRTDIDSVEGTAVEKKLNVARQMACVILANRLLKLLPAEELEAFVKVYYNFIPEPDSDEEYIKRSSLLNDEPAATELSPKSQILLLKLPKTQPPFWMKRMLDGKFDNMSAAMCLADLADKYEVRVLETIETHNVERCNDDERKKRKKKKGVIFETVAVTVRLSAELPPAFPRKDNFADCTSVSGSAKDKTLTVARNAARVEMARQIFKVYKDTAPLVSVRLHIPDEMVTTFLEAAH